MSKKAIIYTRVSTDEQKENGFSLQDQLQQLQKHCEQKGYELLKHNQDDFSAKTFDRPAFKEFLSDLKKKTIKADVFLVTKIDRFSRDLTGTLGMASFLKSQNIILYSIAEGEFDFSDPFKYFTNVMQSATAQYFNLILSDNTKRGMRQAMREGRLMHKAPIGYSDNKYTKIKEIDPNKGPLMEEAFILLAKGCYSAEEVWTQMKGKGLNIAKQTFLNAIKNPFYCGLIYIPAWKDEPEQLVQGIHQPLIEEELFYSVQDIMNGRKKKWPSAVTQDENLPLRGSLLCPDCGRKLTGSGSLGRKKDKKHYYYHCQKKYDCKCRFNADEANSEFLKLLESISIREEVLRLYFEVLKDTFKKDDLQTKREIASLDSEIAKVQERMLKLQDNFVDGKMEAEEYSVISKRYKSQEAELIRKRTELSMEKSSFAKYFDFSLSLLHNLSGYYEKADLSVKQKIIGSIFPEKLTYSEKKYRTAKVNEVLLLLTNNINGLGEVKKEKAVKIDGLSSLAPPSGLEPETL